MLPNFLLQKKTLQSLDIEHLKVSPPMCSCSFLSLNYSPAGHLMNGDVSKVNNDNHESLIHKGKKLKETQSSNRHNNIRYIKNCVEEYAKTWAKHKKEDLDPLSEWIKSVRCMLKSRIKRSKPSMTTIYSSIFKYLEVLKRIDRIHDQFVFVSADKARNSIVFVCKAILLIEF